MKQKTITGSIRLFPDYMSKLRDLLRHRGKAWFYKWIDKEHKKLETE